MPERVDRLDPGAKSTSPSMAAFRQATPPGGEFPHERMGIQNWLYIRSIHVKIIGYPFTGWDRPGELARGCAACHRGAPTACMTRA